MAEMLVFNPRRRHRRRKVARRRRAHARRPRRRRNTGYVMNPTHRRRRRHPRMRRHRRRAFRHNPRILGVNLGQVAGIAGGLIVTEIVASKLASMIPADWKLDPNMARIGAEAVVGIGAPLLLKSVRVIPHGILNAIAIGGGVLVLFDLFKTYAAPALHLSDYELQPGMSSYELAPGTVVVPSAGMSGVEDTGAYAGGAY